MLSFGGRIYSVKFPTEIALRKLKINVPQGLLPVCSSKCQHRLRTHGKHVHRNRRQAPLPNACCLLFSRQLLLVSLLGRPGLTLFSYMSSLVPY